MYKALFILFSLCISWSAFAQTEKMEVEGAIIISDSEDPNPAEGTIRYTGQDFEGFTMNQWKSLTDRSSDTVFHVRAVGLINDATYPLYNGTDNSAILQSIIDAQVGRTLIELPSGGYSFESSIDWKQCSLKGQGNYSVPSRGATVLAFKGTAGLFTSVNDNQGARHERLLIIGSAEKSQNGQTLLDYSRSNYPGLSHVTLANAEVGLLINGEIGTVESHYGYFEKVNFNKCFKGVLIKGSIYSQSHSFHAGRFWDCVTGYENAEGTADIKFYGTEFESDVSIRHVDQGIYAQRAQTFIFGSRDESKRAADIQCGKYYSTGAYTSGDRHPNTIAFSSVGPTDIENDIIFNANNYLRAPVRENILKNPNFIQGGNTSKLPNWFLFGGDLLSITHLGTGPMLHMRRSSMAYGSVGLLQDNIHVKPGVYRWGAEKFQIGGSSTHFTLSDAGTPLVAGVDYTGTASFVGGTNRIHNKITFLREIKQLRFQVHTTGSNNIVENFFANFYLVPGSHSDRYINASDNIITVDGENKTLAAVISSGLLGDPMDCEVGTLRLLMNVSGSPANAILRMTVSMDTGVKEWVQQ